MATQTKKQLQAEVAELKSVMCRMAKFRSGAAHLTGHGWGIPPLDASEEYLQAFNKCRDDSKAKLDSSINQLRETHNLPEDAFCVILRQCVSAGSVTIETVGIEMIGNDGRVTEVTNDE